MRGRVRILGLSWLLALLLALAACGEAERDNTTQAPTGSLADLPSQQFFDYRLVESTAGVREWVLASAEMEKFADQRDAQLRVVNLDFYQNGEHFSVLTADSGSAQLQNRDIHVWGHVTVVTDDGRRLETRELFFDNTSGLVHNDVYNRFTHEGDVMTGIGLEATPDLRYIELKEDVQAKVQDSVGKMGARQ